MVGEIPLSCERCHERTWRLDVEGDYFSTARVVAVDSFVHNVEGRWEIGIGGCERK